MDSALTGLGSHIYHRQGLFYMQEPSASSAVTILDPQPGDWVLDCCAAPGGKSTADCRPDRTGGLSDRQ